MLTKKKCPRGFKKKPISNVVSETSFVCVCKHKENKSKYPQDIYRHCFKSDANTDTMFDYDMYDIKSVLAVFCNLLLIEELS